MSTALLDDPHKSADVARSSPRRAAFGLRPRSVLPGVVVVGAPVLLALLALASSPGCGFSAVVWKNARHTFITPQPAPRADPIVPVVDDGARLAALWVGHATVLLQLGDRVIVTDPVFTEFVGGFSRRLVAAGAAAADVPRHTTAVVSHRHFDHLSVDSLRALRPSLDDVLVPPGATGDLPDGPWRTRSVAAWKSVDVDGVVVTAVPVAHAGDRWPWDGAEFDAAFTGWVVEHDGVSVFFAGDTAYDAATFAAVAARFPHLDAALLPVGPITPQEMMRPHHLDPREALAAFRLLGARFMVPIHFGTFLHSFDEPGEVERALALAVAEAAVAEPDLPDRVHVLLAGERRVLVPRAEERAEEANEPSAADPSHDADAPSFAAPPERP